jgi:preprotein translocase subunit SecY
VVKTIKSFWNRLKLILSNNTLMKRLAITIGLILVIRVCSHITVPLFDATSIQAFMKQNGSFVAILNNFSGQALERFSILSLGITPYITASIITQMLQMVIPSFKEWSEQGEQGKAKMNRINRYLAIVLALIQAFALILGVSPAGSAINWTLPIPEAWQNRYFYYFIMALAMTAGTALCIFIADIITAKGVGNGASILIAAGIVTSFPTMWASLWQKYVTGYTKWTDGLFFAIIILIYIGILVGIIYMELAKRKIPIQYANRQGKSDSHIPLKINSGSVIPVIFASTILSIPLTLISLVKTQNTFTSWMNASFDYRQPIGFALYIILIIVFSFFYSFLTINPNKIAENLSNSNAYIPGVRPGEETKDFVAKLLFKVTVIGTFYLVILAITPIVTSLVFGFTSSEASYITIGGTSLLIVVGVGMETASQMETDASQAEYSGLL